MNTKNDVALLLTYFRKWKSEVNPSEIIKRCKRLVSLYGLSKAAKMVGVSRETMRIWAKLDGLPNEVKRLISKGDLLPTIAFDIVPRRRQIQIAKAVAGLPYKEAKEIIRHLKKTPQKSIKKIRNEVLDEFEEKELAGWWHNACLNFLPDKWDLYATGYKLAGDLLVEHTKNTRSDQDPLVYPIVFLYRQYLELRLKELIKIGSQYLDISQKIPTHHRINDLWKKCKKILEKIPPDNPKNDLDVVEACINQFSETDPSSMAFRYPTDKKGSPSISSLKYINLRILSKVIDRVGSLLDGTSIGISEYISIKREMEAESRNYY